MGVKSNGTSYRIEGVLSRATEGTFLAVLYRIRDGVEGEIDEREIELNKSIGFLDSLAAEWIATHNIRPIHRRAISVGLRDAKGAMVAALHRKRRVKPRHTASGALVPA